MCAAAAATALRRACAVAALAALASAGSPADAVVAAQRRQPPLGHAAPGAPETGTLAARLGAVVATSWTPLALGQVVSGFLPANASGFAAYNFYNYTHTQSNTPFVVYLYPQGTTGDADLFVSDASNPSPQYATPPGATWSCMTDFTDVVAVPGSACPVAPCTFYMSATPYYATDTTYLLTVALQAAPAALQAGQPQAGFVTSNDWVYYYANWTATSMSDRFTLSLSHLTGDPDLCVLVAPRSWGARAREGLRVWRRRRGAGRPATPVCAAHATEARSAPAACQCREQPPRAGALRAAIPVAL